MTDDELCLWSASELAAMLHAGALSAREVLDAHLARIERLNPSINAIVTLEPDRARAVAAAADEALARGEPLGPLHGLPIAHKDLALTAGVRTTFGSPIFADHLPDEDELFVERIRGAGAVMLGKTNTPEFGAGSHTFNPVFGVTHNPWADDRSAGGSSGGAAAALAAGMVPIADGSDLGGSLRNPAAFCGVVGMRPSPGRVPTWPSDDVEDDLSVDGPMARTVADVALLLSVMAGPDPRVPISAGFPDVVLPQLHHVPPLHVGPEVEPLDLAVPDQLSWQAGRAAPTAATPVRVALAPAADGRMPIDPRIVEVIAGHAATFERLGWHVEGAFPDLAGARDAFFTLRARGFAEAFGGLLATERARMKATVVWNIEQGMALTPDDVERARRAMTDVRRRTEAFFERFDVLAMPTTQVLPFPVDQEFPTEIEGVPMSTYLDWMESCWCITVTGHPAISVPAGWVVDDDGMRLPVGIQLVGRRAGDVALLAVAHAFEQAAAV